MPCHKLVDPRLDIRNCDLARLVRQRVVRIVHRISEALHICMKPTLHHENPPPLRHANLLRLGFAGYVLVVLGVGTRRFGMVGIHRQRHVEKDAWPQLRGFVSLNVMHDRIHVDNLNLANAPQDIDVWKKSAVAGFDASYGKVEGFSSLNAVSRLPTLRLTNNAKEYFQRRRCNCFMPITSYLPIKNYTTGRKRAGEPQTRVRLPHPNVFLCRHGFTSKRSEVPPFRLDVYRPSGLPSRSWIAA